MEMFNIYCDESCHLENDSKRFMVLGALWCPFDKVHEIAKRIREIKEKHFKTRYRETKWNKVSQAKLEYYLDLIDYFFDDTDLHFRAIIADKTNLDHGRFRQSHDDWYYKMYFSLLKIILNPKSNYSIYIDIKDTLGGCKVKELRKVLCNSNYDFSQRIIERVQITHSHEIEQLQLADLLIGALSYYHNISLNHQSAAKLKLIERIKQRSNYSLEKNTLVQEKKLNLFFWESC